MTKQEGGKVLTFRWAGSPLIIPEVRQSGSGGPQDAEGSSVAFGPKPERPNCSFIMSHAIEYSRSISERSDECVECA